MARGNKYGGYTTCTVCGKTCRARKKDGKPRAHGNDPMTYCGGSGIMLDIGGVF